MIEAFEAQEIEHHQFQSSICDLNRAVANVTSSECRAFSFWRVYLQPIFCPQHCSDYPEERACAEHEVECNTLTERQGDSSWLTWCAVHRGAAKEAAWCCGWEARLLMKEPGLCADSLMLPTWTLACYLTSPCLSFFIWKIEISITM